MHYVHEREHKKDGVHKKHFGWGARHIILLLLLFGNLIISLLISSLDVLYLQGPLSEHIKEEEQRYDSLYKHITGLSDYQRYILESCTDYSSPIGTLIGGVLSVKFNNKYTIVLQGLAYSLCAMCIELIFKLVGFDGAIVLACINGLVRGWSDSSIMAIIGNWTPVHERGRSAVIVIQWSNMLYFMFNSWVPAVGLRLLRLNNYLTFLGALGLIWCVLWFIFGSQDPASSFLCSEEEQEYIFENLTRLKMPHCKSRVPFREVLTCPAIYGLGFVFVIFTATKFVLTNVEITETMVVAVAPQHKPKEFRDKVTRALYFVAFFSYIVAFISDKFIERGYSLNNMRKVGNSIGFWGMAVCMSFMVYSSQLTLVFFVMSIYFMNIARSCGLLVAVFDLTPSFAGFTYALLTWPNYVLLLVWRNVWNAVVPDLTVKTYWTRFYFQFIFLLYISNGIFLMSGTIRMIPFHHLETMLWEEQRIPSYPDVDIVTRQK